MDTEDYNKPLDYVLALSQIYLTGFNKSDWHNFEKSCVYVITNKLTKQYYIGKAKHPAKRVYEHLMGHTNCQSFINQKTWKEFNVELFECETLKEAEETELKLINELNSISTGYNTYGQGNVKHSRLTEEVKASIIQAKVEGIKNDVIQEYIFEEYGIFLSKSRICNTKSKIK